MSNRDELLDNCDTICETLLTEIDRADLERKKTTEEMDAVSALAEKLIAENASATMERKKYNRRYGGLSEQFDRTQKRSGTLKRRKGTLFFKIDMIECFMTKIRLMPELPIDFDELHWHKPIDHVTVHSDGRFIFSFKTEIKIMETL